MPGWEYIIFFCFFPIVFLALGIYKIIQIIPDLYWDYKKFIDKKSKINEINKISNEFNNPNITRALTDISKTIGNTYLLSKPEYKALLYLCLFGKSSINLFDNCLRSNRFEFINIGIHGMIHMQYKPITNFLFDIFRHYLSFKFNNENIRDRLKVITFGFLDMSYFLPVDGVIGLRNLYLNFLQLPFSINWTFEEKVNFLELWFYQITLQSSKISYNDMKEMIDRSFDYYFKYIQVSNEPIKGFFHALEIFEMKKIWMGKTFHIREPFIFLDENLFFDLLNSKNHVYNFSFERF